MTRYVPQVALATAIVAVLPVVVVWELRAHGVVPSPWLCLVLAIALSIAASSAGSAYWKRRRGAGDMLFSELMLWGWLWRWSTERQLARSARQLGLTASGPGEHIRRLRLPRRSQLLRQLVAGFEAQDRYMRGHSRRVARHAAAIARRMGLPADEVVTIRAAALIHDVGKLRVPASILNKPDRLTEAEFDVIKRHPADGASIVSSLENEELTRIVLHHHERLDGHGYPAGLAGDQIPIGARIVAVADTFDAITSARPYRSASEHKRALDVLSREAGHQLDPDAVRAFLSLYAGRRAIAVWVVALAAPRRAFPWLSSSPASAATVTTGQALSTALATVAIGGAAISSPLTIATAHASGDSRGAAAAEVSIGAQSHARLVSDSTAAWANWRAILAAVSADRVKHGYAPLRIAGVPVANGSHTAGASSLNVTGGTARAGAGGSRGAAASRGAGASRGLGGGGSHSSGGHRSTPPSSGGGGSAGSSGAPPSSNGGGSQGSPAGGGQGSPVGGGLGSPVGGGLGSPVGGGTSSSAKGGTPGGSPGPVNLGGGGQGGGGDHGGGDHGGGGGQGGGGGGDHGGGGGGGDHGGGGGRGAGGGHGGGGGDRGHGH